MKQGVSGDTDAGVSVLKKSYDHTLHNTWLLSGNIMTLSIMSHFFY